MKIARERKWINRINELLADASKRNKNTEATA